MNLIHRPRQARAFASLPAIAGVVFLAIAFCIWWWPQLVYWMFIIFFALIGVGLLLFALKMKPNAPPHRAE